jgi:tRNA pseudouridine65 synthase
MLLKVLHRDDDYIAIDKPAGLLVHRTQLDTHATEFALQLLRDQIGQEVFPCHRLDRPTSGVLLFALNESALRFAQSEFIERRVLKTYHAVVRGWTEDSGHIDYELRVEEKPKIKQSAQTDYICLARSELNLPVGRYTSARFSLLELKPLTGRKHQLRRHLAHIRHPIIGDTRHGDGIQNRFIRTHFECHQLLLRATQLEIQHPKTDTPLIIQADNDPSFSRVIEALDLRTQG